MIGLAQDGKAQGDHRSTLGAAAANVEKFARLGRIGSDAIVEVESERACPVGKASLPPIT
jgi:hypothetical protein